jgi:hypothetical protein
MPTEPAAMASPLRMSLLPQVSPGSPARLSSSNVTLNVRLAPELRIKRHQPGINVASSVSQSPDVHFCTVHKIPR